MGQRVVQASVSGSVRPAHMSLDIGLATGSQGALTVVVVRV